MSSKQPCKIVIEDEVNCRFEGLHPTHVQKLVKQYALPAPNFRFHPKYKLGIWDGMLPFFKSDGTTLVYLLDEIIPKIIEFGYSPKLVDKRKGPYVDAQFITKDHFGYVVNQKTGQPMELRYYQVELVNALIAEGKGLIVASTSAGKTWCNAALVDAYGKLGLKTLTIVPSTSLVIQTLADFQTAGLDVGEYTGRAKDLEHTHIICTWQALKNQQHLMNQFQVLVVDEVHGAKSDKLRELVNKAGRNIPYRFGLTGTLPKDPVEALTIHTGFGDVLYTIPAHVLQEQNYVAKCDVHLKVLHEDHPDGYFPDYAAEKSYLTIRKERLEWIADKIIERASRPKGNSLVLVNSVTFGKKLQKLIPNSVFLHGADKADVRKQEYDMFDKEDNLVVIATVQIAGTGLSIDRIFNLFLIDIGKSFTRVIQAIGRGIRMGRDKDHVDIYDISSNLKFSARHRAERVKYYKEAQYPYKKEVVKYRDYDSSGYGDSQNDNLLAEIESNTSLDY